MAGLHFIPVPNHPTLQVGYLKSIHKHVISFIQISGSPESSLHRLSARCTEGGGKEPSSGVAFNPVSVNPQHFGSGPILHARPHQAAWGFLLSL